MALNLDLVWHHPYELRPGRAHEPLLMMCDQLDRIPDRPGAYMFGRQFGGVVEPLYIGQAISIQKRVAQHLEGNVRLVKAIQEAKNGARVVVPCELVPKRGQQLDKALDLLESALFRISLSHGYELLNVQGVRTPHHTLTFSGAREGTRLSGKSALVPSR